MRTGQRIAQNSLFLLLARLGSAGMNFLILSLLARYLSRDDFGRYQFILAFVTIFQFVMDFGFSSILVREAAVNKPQARRVFGVLQAMMGATSLVAFVAMVAYARWRTHYPQETVSITLAAAATIFFMQCNLTNAIFRAFEKLEWEAVTVLASRVFDLVGTLIVIKTDAGVPGIFTVYLVSQAVHYLLSLTICGVKFVRPAFVVDFDLMKSLFLAAAPLGVAQIFRRVSWQVDVMLLEAMVGLQFVALFSGAYRIVWGLMILPNALGASLFPVLSNLAQSSPQRLLNAYERTLKYLIVLGLFIAVVGTLAAEPIVRLLLGHKYVGAKFAGSVLALQIVIWAVVFIFPSAVFGYVFTALHRQKLFTVCSAACLGINIALDLLLIPRWQHIGACVGTVTAEMVLFALGAFYLARFVGTVSWSQVAFKPLLAAAVMGAQLYFFRDAPPMVLPIALIGAGAVYALMLLMLGTFTADELALWSRRKPKQPTGDEA
ncbi:MAG: flippase [Abditibacteriales bacterium]|nr:flippase [Abditibacteriales bacterium]MDW8367813.1 flippase [Abditibacteriales bacterium]